MAKKKKRQSWGLRRHRIGPFDMSNEDLVSVGVAGAIVAGGLALLFGRGLRSTAGDDDLATPEEIRDRLIGETPEQAAHREWLESVGMTREEWASAQIISAGNY